MDVGPSVIVEMEEETGVAVLNAVDVAVDIDKRVMPDGNTVAL